MVITEIKLQKRNKKRCSIFADGHYLMSMGIETLQRMNVKEGDQITETFYQDILRTEEKRRIGERMARMLGYRDRTAKELKTRFARLGFDEGLVAEVVADYVASKVLDDERLVQSFIADYTNLNPRGNLYIKGQLLAKGIERKVIDRYLNERDERAVARRFLDKQTSRRRELNRAKAYRLLASRGFTPSVVSEVVGEEF